jgi:steroid delta-isomerase-like uncharacterized protein
MSVEVHKAIVRRYLDQVVNKVDAAAARELVAENLVFHSPYTPEPTRDRESFLGMLTAIHTALPDFRLVEHAVLAEGDLVASRWTVVGTHAGPIGPFAPTNRRLEISGISIYRIADGKIAEGWVEDKTMELLFLNAAQAAPA